ncbi:MAG: iron chaperone [Pseudomarimonas sp.]
MKVAAVKPESVEHYIQSFPTDVGAILSEIRRVVREAAPEAEERISYRMPSLFQNEVVVHYAAFKKHIGLFPPVADSSLKQHVAAYAGPKGNLQFPLDKPIPYALIQKIAKARLTANLASAAAKRGA